MEINVDIKEFSKAVGKLNAFAEEDKVLHLPPKVKVVAKDGKMTLTCTDAESHGQFSFPCDGEMSFVIALRDLVSATKLRGNPTLTLDDGKIKIEEGQTQMQFPVSDVENYPALQEDNSVDYLTLPAGKLKKFLNKISYAKLEKDSRLFLTVVKLDVDGKDIDACATTGAFLLTNHMEIEGNEAKFSGLLTSRALRCISSCNDDEDADISILDDKLRLHTSSDYIILPLLNVTYPNVSKLLTNTDNATFTLDKDDVLNSMRIFQGLDNIEIKLSKNDASNIKFESDTGVHHVVDVVPMEGVAGGDFSFSVNIPIFESLFKNLGDGLKKLTFTYQDNVSQVLVSDEENLKGAVMPMRE